MFKKSGLGLQGPLTSSNKKYLSLLHDRRDMIGAVTGKISFSTANHHMEIREERHDGQKSGMTPMRPKSRY